MTHVELAEFSLEIIQLLSGSSKFLELGDILIDSFNLASIFPNLRFSINHGSFLIFEHTYFFGRRLKFLH